MKNKQFFLYFLIVSFSFRLFADVLPSWNEGPAKQSILDFVRTTTDPSNPKFVPPENRIATFDQDGTLWVEHPLYTQAIYVLDRVKDLTPTHPDWKKEEPFKAIIARDQQAIEKFQEHDWEKILGATLSGMTNADFLSEVKRWLQTAKHPRFKRPYTELVYQPMLEVMDYLRQNSFKIYIVTGGGQDFVRAYGQSVYGVPPEHVIGSSISMKYEMRNGTPVLLRLPKIFFIDNFDGKAIGINLFIGKRPYAAFGNSDGDREMLEWTQAGEGLRLMMLVHHDDPVREYAYGPAGGLPNTTVGTFSDSLLTEAQTKGWTVISMKRDWKRIFPFEK